MEENKKPLSLLEKMKQKAKEQKAYGGECKEQAASVGIRACPGCGAGRAQQDGLTHCAYCGYEFLSAPLTDGIYITKENNSGNA